MFYFSSQVLTSLPPCNMPKERWHFIETEKPTNKQKKPKKDKGDNEVLLWICLGLWLIEHYICSCQYLTVSYPEPWHLLVRSWPGTEEVLRCHGNRKNSHCHLSTGQAEEWKLQKGQVAQPLESGYLPAQMRSALKHPSGPRSEAKEKASTQNHYANFTGCCCCAWTAGTPLKRHYIHHSKRQYRTQNIPVWQLTEANYSLVCSDSLSHQWGEISTLRKRFRSHVR